MFSLPNVLNSCGFNVVFIIFAHFDTQSSNTCINRLIDACRNGYRNSNEMKEIIKRFYNCFRLNAEMKYLDDILQLLFANCKSSLLSVQYTDYEDLSIDTPYVILNTGILKSMNIEGTLYDNKGEMYTSIMNVRYNSKHFTLYVDDDDYYYTVYNDCGETHRILKYKVDVSEFVWTVYSRN